MPIYNERRDRMSLEIWSYANSNTLFTQLYPTYTYDLKGWGFWRGLSRDFCPSNRSISKSYLRRETIEEKKIMTYNHETFRANRHATWNDDHHFEHAK